MAVALAVGAMLTMNSTAPKITFAGLLVVALAGTAAWAIAPRGQEQGGKPAAPQSPEGKAIAAWRTVCRLERDEVVNRVAPPFIPERMADAESRFPLL